MVSTIRLPSYGAGNMMHSFLKFSLLGLLTVGNTVFAAGTLGENQIISSKFMGYDLQYRVYLPEAYETLENLPVIYVTDGQWYISEGDMHLKIDKEIADGNIEPVIAVFVDNRDPHNLRDNRRNSEFICNKNYARFYEQELVPKIAADYKTRNNRESRVILGLSFGGLNSACFGFYAYRSFAGIAMQSPALHPVKNLFEMYEQFGKLPIRIFLSTGTIRDNTNANRRWHRHLKKLGYEVTYREVRESHNWKNWRPLMDDVLKTFFAVKGN